MFQNLQLKSRPCLELNKFCSFYLKAANGVCDKQHDVLKQFLANVTCHHSNEWDNYLLPVLFGVMETTSEFT